MSTIPILASGQGMIGLMLVLGAVFWLVAVGAVFCRSEDAAERKRGERLAIAGILLLVVSIFLWPLIERYL